MPKNKPTIPSGTRDFGPEEVSKRQYIINTIKAVYELYGYQPLETPVLENLTTLMGKYGDEGDKLLFKILNSGDYLKNADDELLQRKNSNQLLSKISEKGLRYDLTVPFARYVVMHQNEITFPFKRFQIQPVWRADRPQKGRYREFYQCDADVIGSNSLLYDAEMVQMISDVFEQLKLNVTIRLNNRKILEGLAEYIEEPEKLNAITIAIDKLDKVGIEGVKKELVENGFDDNKIEKLTAVINTKGESKDIISHLEKIFTSENGKRGIAEIKELFERIAIIHSSRTNILFDLTLARGLSYYTGTIYEVITNDVKMGSILGGGRYDDLTGIFGLPNMSGVGISFGLDRIYDVITELNLFPESALSTSGILIIPFDIEAEKLAVTYAVLLRKNNIKTEIYPELDAKLGKKLKYADDKKIPYAGLIGSNEIQAETITLKNLKSGEQKSITIAELVAELTNDITTFLDISE